MVGELDVEMLVGLYGAWLEVVLFIGAHLMIS